MKQRGESIVAESTHRVDRFFAAAAAAPRRLLVLDYDGTLAPFHVDPMEAKPYQGVRELLDGIMRDPASEVIVVSGRPARDLWPLLRLHRRPAIWGSHGWEILSADGDYRCGPVDIRALRKTLQDDAWIQAIEACGGRFERKPASVAIHWRGLDATHRAHIRRIVRDHWDARNLGAHMAWHYFDGGVELRIPGRDKGFVVRQLIRRYPDASVAFLGDDLTDEDAFKAIDGRGLGVLVRPDLRPTAAQAWLQPPEQLLEFLTRWHVSGRHRSL